MNIDSETLEVIGRYLERRYVAVEATQHAERMAENLYTAARTVSHLMVTTEKSPIDPSTPLEPWPSLDQVIAAKDEKERALLALRECEEELAAVLGHSPPHYRARDPHWPFLSMPASSN